MERVLEEVWSDKGLEGKYLFERQIATSSMAVVVAARHLELDERVAIKFLSPDAIRSKTAVSRFRSEAKAAAKIKSQHVVRIIDVATTVNNIPYIVMEYLDGQDLEQLLAQFSQRRAPISDAVDFILQASEAVCEGHALGIVHRDLKPANLFCVDRGDGYPLIKVLDFGISKCTTMQGGVARTDRHEILGSPRYMSPEQIESAAAVDARTDIWSLGVILYETLTGRPPFDEERILGLWRKIKEDTPTPIPLLRAECPPDLWQVVAKCLQKDPDLRFADLGELAGALAPFAPERSRPCIGRIRWITENNKVSTIKSSLFTDSYDRVSTSPMHERHRWIVAGGIASVVGLGLGMLAFARGTDRGDPGKPQAMSKTEYLPAIVANAAAEGASSPPVVPVKASVEAQPAPSGSAATDPTATMVRAKSPHSKRVASARPSEASTVPGSAGRAVDSPVPTASIQPNDVGKNTSPWVMPPVTEWK